MIDEGRTATAGEEVLTDRQRQFEALALRLRTPAGVPAGALSDDEDLDGLVERVDGRAVLTVRGRLLANAVTARLAIGVEGRVSAGTIPPYA
jgi:coproporphyrinogen III oxidase-like Fe-S oxidoreductase